MTAIAKEQKITTNNQMEMKLSAFNDISSAWKQLFDNPPNIPLLFAVNDRNQLTLDNIIIDDFDSISAADAEFISDYIYLPSANRPGCYYRVHIIWTADDEVYVDEISLVLFAHAS